MQVQSIAGRRIKERVIMHQDQQKEVFDFLFTIFTTVYIILLVFIQASLKFIRVMATGPIKGILGMLGPFYNNSREGSRQPINLQSFPNPEDAVPDLTPVMSRTNNLQQREDKNQEVNLPILEETASLLPYNKTTNRTKQGIYYGPVYASSRDSRDPLLYRIKHIIIYQTVQATVYLIPCYRR